jgi:predicted ester cyclase
MSVQSNQTLARCYLVDFWNRGDANAIGEIVAAEAIGHVAGQQITAGPSMLLARRSALLGIYAGPTFTLEDEIAAGDKVVLRWTLRGRHTGAGAGVPPTGKEVIRIADGKIAELWVESDDLGELRQLGVLPAAG